MRDLKSLSKTEFNFFFHSFDEILCDVHGVLWNITEAIPGASKTINLLQKLGKNIIIVSNNTTVLVEDYQQEFKKANMDIPIENIITPSLTIISYLKKQNISKNVYALGTEALKKSLEKAGFTTVELEPNENIQTLKTFGKVSTQDDDSIGAVIADCDFNLNYVNLQKAATYLKRPEVVFIKGCTDFNFKIGFDRFIMGVGLFYKILEEHTGRKGIPVGKPSTILNEFILEKYKIKNPKRVLFIGDSVISDMGFAGKFGYQKLLVFTGVTQKEVLEKWEFSEEFKPEFYVESLGVLYDLIKKNMDII